MTTNWQTQLASAFTDFKTLFEYLQLSPSELNLSSDAAKQFPLRVPLAFAARIEKGNPHDPLLRQILPIDDELKSYAGFSDDPVGDLNAVKQTGVLHKYHGRVLLINTGACAIHCRYCFRRNFPYADLQLNKQQESDVIQTIQNDTSIQEVILSGGDPLILNDARLARLFEALEGISTLKRIRIHTRLPIVLPARVTDELLFLLENSSKKIIVVVHCNHANEIGDDVAQACQRLKSAGVTLLNQSVLLCDVNNDVETLCTLSERLFEVGVLPYYLHFLDKANGTGHFQVSKTEALALLTAVQNRLSGYLVPKLVTEQAGELAKQYLR
ncbi:MAG: EF-P beta-lysylation protein EpmB [Methylococcales bacterium]|nr:EF-P beta-lysylation protein EpmB [Methylococcales bacterium]